MKRLFFVLLLGSVPVMMQGQSNSVIERMRRERAEMEEQIARQENG